MFYNRTFAKNYKPLRFDLPGKVDEEFYQDIKNRQAHDTEVQFSSEVSLWKLYRVPVIIILVFLSSLVYSIIFFLIQYPGINKLFYIPLFFMVLGIRPAIASFFLIWHFLKYKKAEKKFHKDFNQSVARSNSFSDFESQFYSGQYRETMVLNGYLLQAPFQPIKNFAESNNLEKHLTIYKFSKGDNYILLSNSVELTTFIERQTNIAPIPKNDKILQIIKQQFEFPYVYGNKKLKHLIDYAKL